MIYYASWQRKLKHKITAEYKEMATPWTQAQKARVQIAAATLS